MTCGEAKPTPKGSSTQRILLISALSGAGACAEALSLQLQMAIEVAAAWKEAMNSLRRRQYAAVIVDDSLAEADPQAADLIWKHSAPAIPLQLNFALSSEARIARDVRAALARRTQEQALASRAASAELAGELKSIVTGLLLQSQLVLEDPALTPQTAEKLRIIHELAGSLRRCLQHPQS